MTLPLEDNFEDILGKARRGCGLSVEQCAFRAGLPAAAVQSLLEGRIDDRALRLLAPVLGLCPQSLIASARRAWRPDPVELSGLIPFTTQYSDMTVNSFVIYDPVSLDAAIIDTGANATGMLVAIAARGLKVKAIFLTHTHRDHIMALDAVRKTLGNAIPAYVGHGEIFPGARPVEHGQTWEIGALRVEARETSGHSPCGMTYVFTGLSRPVACAGDALFAGSMGGGMVSWPRALDTNRRHLFSLPDDTIVCPGHGPLTTIGAEKRHNPFYPELKPNRNPRMSQRIAFVGTGRMGANMARRVKDIGYSVTAVYDVNSAVAEELATEIGAKACTKLSDVTAAADVIFTVVSNDEAMKAIFHGEDNLLTGAAGRIFINCATLSPQLHIDTEKACEAAGAQSIEGCMASSIPQARQGTLQLMIGGKKEVFDAVEPLLKQMSAVLTYVGASGKAAEVKALVNMVMNINTAALAEGLGLGAALGLDLKMLCEVFAVTGANSRVLQTDGEDMLNRDHSCFFSAEHAAKDSNIALRLAKQKGLTLPLAGATADQFERMTSMGLGELDKSGIAELTFPGRALHKA